MKYLKIFLCLFAMYSCNNWLDIDLANKVDEDKLFSTPDGFREALAGVYSEMSKAKLYGKYLTMEYMDVYAQYYSYNSISSEYEVHRDYDYKDAVVENIHASIWSNMYSCISGANNILNWLDKNRSILTNEEHDRFKGEALGLRAFLHFDLYRMFCPDVKLYPKDYGIPYNKVFGVSLPPQYAVEEVVQLVINDLLEAEEWLENEEITTVIPYLMSSKDDADKYVARMNLYAVKALLARVYQAKGDYVRAVKYAKEVIDSEKFRLLDFSSIDKSEQETDVLFSDEHIFSLRNKDLSDISKSIHYRIDHSSGSYSNPKLPFAEISTVYEGNNDDARYTKWFNAGNFMKYVSDNDENFFRKMPIIKLSEMYLILSDCLFNTESDSSLEFINTLRDHRIRNNVHWNSLTREYIVEEMKREFLGEGQMWYVYKRKNMGIPTNGIVGTVDPSNSVFVFPIPRAEIENGYRNVN